MPEHLQLEALLSNIPPKDLNPVSEGSRRDVDQFLSLLFKNSEEVVRSRSPRVLPEDYRFLRLSIPREVACHVKSFQEPRRRTTRPSRNERFALPMAILECNSFYILEDPEIGGVSGIGRGVSHTETHPKHSHYCYNRQEYFHFHNLPPFWK